MIVSKGFVGSGVWITCEIFRSGLESWLIVWCLDNLSRSSVCAAECGSAFFGRLKAEG